MFRYKHILQKLKIQPNLRRFKCQQRYFCSNSKFSSIFQTLLSIPLSRKRNYNLIFSKLNILSISILNICFVSIKWYVSTATKFSIKIYIIRQLIPTFEKRRSSRACFNLMRTGRFPTQTRKLKTIKYISLLITFRLYEDVRRILNFLLPTLRRCCLCYTACRLL